MNTQKLQEALADIEAQESVLHEAATRIRQVIALFDQPHPVMATERIESVDTRASRTYVDDTVDVLSAVGHPLHIINLTEEVSKLRGVPVSRASLESSLVRHIHKVSHPLIGRFGRAKFGLSIWTETQPTLAQIA